ncbi:CPBP family intramembrane metalloprotease [Maribellus comscasis]|uniref:CPBP family intramembrane metalloprotease n=1 Tax=Maribellus comscasis TaxID=2681766 RepID=A0A6I6JP42_9BACT|nr:CPBP family intramembrane glutamic endopeptidase [Maribellus comscasis]QGY44746.1 CPBP family intramembrane metalloprotease [Maribellus comscasis]
MRNKSIFNRPAGWFVLGVFALISVFYVYLNFDKANSLINIEIEMDREAALKKAALLAQEFEIGPQEFKQTAAFRNDSRFQNFVELECGGLDTFTNIISKGYYYSYNWTVRHFKEQDANEVTFWFNPNGDIYGFKEKVPETQKGAALEQDEALRIAEHIAIYNWDVDLTPYDLIEKSKKEQISGRVDHTFVYERNDKSIGDGKFRLTLVVSGDKLSTVNYSVKIPEDFNRRYSEMRSANNTIATISSAAIAIFYGLLGVILGIFALMRKRRLIWKPALYWGLGIAFASVFLLTLNSLPFSWFSYDTSSSQSNYLARQLLNGLLGALGFGSIIAVSFMAAEGLGRMAFPKHIQWWKIWSKNSGGSLPVLGQTIGGYLFAVIILAFDVLFYLTTTTHFGWWSPAGTLSDPNILATYLPWLDSIAISLQAGFWEEALFRAVPVAGVFILTKGKKWRNFWIVFVLILQTLIFGSAHANYAQQPSYARVLEMIVPFTIMGIIYIYFGILPGVIAHYTVDVFWISLPLWVSSTEGIWLDRSLVLLFLFVPLFIVLFIRFRNKKWTKVPEEEKNGAWKEPVLIERKSDVIPTIETKKLNVEKWILALGAAGLIAWVLFKPFKMDAPVLQLNKTAAIETAKTELTDRYHINFEDWTILTSVNDAVDIRDIFVWQLGGDSIYKQMLKNYLAPPHWRIRLVKTEGKAEDKTEEYAVQVGNDKKILAVSHILPEKAKGKNLSENEAQTIADSVLLSGFLLKKETLKRISVTPEKQENRTDWEFIYADTTNFPLAQGQGRYRIKISGDEVTSAYSFVYVPEEWTRNYKETENKKSIIKTISTILIAGTILLGLVLAIIRWTRKKFRLKLFIKLAIVFALLYFIENWFSWPTAIANYSTQLPMSNFITTLLIGIAISGIFFTLFYSIFIAATPGWIPLKKSSLPKRNILYALGLGLFVTGTFTAIQSLLPKAEPYWMSFDFLNGKLSSFLLAVSNTPGIILYPAFAFVLFFGIHSYTQSWTRNKWIGISLAVLGGLSLNGINFENYSVWIITTILTVVLIGIVYFFFIRFHFEWIPFGFGMIPVLGMISKIFIAPNSVVTLGAVLMITMSVALLFWWYSELIKQNEKR